MALLRWQQNIVDEEGNVLPSATVEIRDEVSGSLVNLFEDIGGVTPKGNPLTVDSDGYGFAYMEPGRFKITATSADQSFTKSWRDVRLANDFSELDSRINQRVIYVGSVAELEARTPISGQQASLSGLRSGIFEFSNSNLSTEVSADPQQGEYIAPDSDATGASGAWVRQSIRAITPEMFGAVGDGVADDTAAVKAWWEYSGYKKSAGGEYLISGTDQFLCAVTGFDLIADLRGAEFFVSVPRAYLFRATISENGRSAFVFGGKIQCQDNAARPVTIETNSVTASVVWATDLIINDVFANDGLGYSSSAVGVYLPCEASLIVSERNTINGVNRGYVNPGSVASVGISVSEVVGSLFMNGNIINDIQSPAGDADADGISIFSRDRLLVGRQPVKIEVSGNRLRNCKGRFFKFQTTEAHAWGNRMESTTGELITSFRAVDCQFGGCNIHDNFWNLYAGVTGGNEATFAKTNFKDEGNWESRTVVRDNFLVLERELRYFFSATLTGGVSQIEVKNNYIKANQSTDFLTQNLTRIDTPDLSAVTSCRIEVKGNTYPADRDSVLQLVGSVFSGDASAASKLQYEITDNTNTRDPSTKNHKLIEVAAGDTIPHLRSIVLRGNNTGGQHRQDSKSTNLNLMPVGNEFYYGTDGSTGGMSNAPTGYNRFVHVCTRGREQILGSNNNSQFAKRIEGSASWYEYTGTLI